MIIALVNLRQEDHRFNTSLFYTASLCHRNKSQTAKPRRIREKKKERDKEIKDKRKKK